MKFFKYIAKFVFLFLFFGSAFADVPYIPPTSPQAIVSQAAHLTPVEAWQVRNGVDLKNRSIDLNKFHAQYGSAQSKNGTVTGAKSHPATFVDNHGATARGSFKTTTVMPANNTLANLGGAMVVGQVGGSIANSSHAQQAAQELANGNYGTGLAHALAALDYTGIGQGLNGLKDAYKSAVEAKARGVIGSAEAQNANSGYDPGKSQALVYYFYPIGQPENKSIAYVTYVDSIYSVYDTNKIYILKMPERATIHVLPHPGYGTYSIGREWVSNTPDLWRKSLTLDDILLNQQEVESLILQALNNNSSALNNNSQALTNFINALWANGGLNPGNTTTTVDNGGTAQTTFLTAPYTPQGSTQAQQTSFTIHPDGSVTATTIPRPDLAANTSQAPTRAPVGQTATAPATTAPKETATPEAPDICANNPNSLMCAGIGSVDYSDPVLPETSIDISLNPLNVFASGGVCPQPVGFDLLGSRQEFRYDSMCDVAQKARPWIIILSMLFSFTLVYYALGLGKK